MVAKERKIQMIMKFQGQGFYPMREFLLGEEER